MSINGILGRKIGSTQIFQKDGAAVAVTVIEAGPCTVVQIKTPERDGYHAVQLGFGTARSVNSPLMGHMKKLGRFKHMREFRNGQSSDLEIGSIVNCDIFSPGDLVSISGTGKGKGFAGVVKRYNFRGGPRTHGQSDRWRAPGSIGAGTDPGRVIKGLKMAGHMGTRQITVKNLLVLRSDPDKGILLVRGAVPGNKNGLLKIRLAKWGQAERQ